MKRGTFRKKTVAEIAEMREKKRQMIQSTKSIIKAPQKPVLGSTERVKQKKTTKRMIYGQKVWSLSVAHTKFSLWLREKIPYCELCGVTEGLTVSHYIGRKEKATTFDLENCDVFCWSCHAKWEDRKQYEYRDWKIAKIGEERHEALKLKARNGLGEKDAIYNLMKLMNKI